MKRWIIGVGVLPVLLAGCASTTPTAGPHRQRAVAVLQTIKPSVPSVEELSAQPRSPSELLSALELRLGCDSSSYYSPVEQICNRNQGPGVFLHTAVTSSYLKQTIELTRNSGTTLMLGTAAGNQRWIATCRCPAAELAPLGGTVQK